MEDCLVFVDNGFFKLVNKDSEVNLKGEQNDIRN